MNHDKIAAWIFRSVRITPHYDTENQGFMTAKQTESYLKALMVVAGFLNRLCRFHTMPLPDTPKSCQYGRLYGLGSWVQSKFSL
jgi:hypothetical protein